MPPASPRRHFVPGMSHLLDRWSSAWTGETRPTSSTFALISRSDRDQIRELTSTQTISFCRGGWVNVEVCCIACGPFPPHLLRGVRTLPVAAPADFCKGQLLQGWIKATASSHHVPLPRRVRVTILAPYAALIPPRSANFPSEILEVSMNIDSPPPCSPERV